MSEAGAQGLSSHSRGDINNKAGLPGEAALHRSHDFIQAVLCLDSGWRVCERLGVAQAPTYMSNAQSHLQAPGGVTGVLARP